MNCKECLDRLEELVDKELSPLEASEVQIHLENCAPCTEHFEFQAGMKRLVRTCCQQDKAPDSLRLRLREILNS
jgi:mycothiol system anti-sigma-R factor